MIKNRVYRHTQWSGDQVQAHRLTCVVSTVAAHRCPASNHVCATGLRIALEEQPRGLEHCFVSLWSWVWKCSMGHLAVTCNTSSVWASQKGFCLPPERCARAMGRKRPGGAFLYSCTQRPPWRILCKYHKYHLGRNMELSEYHFVLAFQTPLRPLSLETSWPLGR